MNRGGIHQFRFRGLSALTLFTVIAACSTPDREAQLRDTIHGMAAAIEAHEAEPFLRHVADDFSGERGAWDAGQVRRYVLGQSMRREPVSISLDIDSVTLHGDRATAVIDAGFAESASWMPGRGERFRFQTGWRLADGDWKLIRADWERLN